MGNRVAKAALDAVVGVVGAETGCPEIDDGRTLDREDPEMDETHRDTEKAETHKQSATKRKERQKQRQKERALV